MKLQRTPQGKLIVWLLALAWLLLQPIASWVYYETNFRRGAYPPETDTIIIGQMQAVVGWGITLPLFLAFFWFSLRQYPGQVSLLAFNRDRVLWSSIWSALLLALAVMYGWSLVRSTVGFFPLDIASESLAVYLLLCCRSSLMYSRIGTRRYETASPHA